MFTSVIELTDIINYVGDFKRQFVEGSQIVKCNHIVEFGCKENTPNLTKIIAMCLKTSDLSGKPHELEVIKTTINDGQVALSGRCSCKAGSGKCKHIVGLLLKLQNVDGNTTLFIKLFGESIHLLMFHIQVHNLLLRTMLPVLYRFKENNIICIIMNILFLLKGKK